MNNQKKGKEFDKYKIQDNEYLFPYHYIPYFDQDNSPHRMRVLQNGFEYLCYTQYVINLVKNTDSKSILEVGCGDGRILNMLNYKNAVGVDLSGKAITFAKAFNPDLKLIIGDASDIEDCYDIIIAIEVLEHIPNEISDVFWNTLYNKLNLKGKLIISVPSVNKPLIKKHFRHYDENVLMKEIDSAGLSDKFSVKTVQYVYSEDKIIKFWKKFSNNRYFIFELNSLKKYIWKRIEKKLTKVSSKEGLHLVVELIKEK